MVPIPYLSNVIEVQNLSKSFDAFTAVDDASFSVPEGETLVLLGTSGSGKTTTLKMLNRLIEPDQGTIRINGQEVKSQPPEQLRRQVGYVIQHIGLFPHYTVAQNIAIVPQLLGWSAEQIQARTDELMALLKLPDELEARKPEELSGGQQQRVGLARALAADPPVILLDEPFGALDPITRSQIVNEFKELEALKYKTKVMVTHDVHEAVSMGHQIALMDQGRIQQLGAPQDLVFRPQNDFVRRFFAGQLFRLELEVATLGDLWPFLNGVKGGELQALRFESTATLWQVMQKASAATGSDPLIAIAGKDWRGDQSQLMVAFQRLKNKWSRS